MNLVRMQHFNINTYVNVVTTPDIKVHVTGVEIIAESTSPKICKSASVIISYEVLRT